MQNWQNTLALSIEISWQKPGAYSKIPFFLQCTKNEVFHQRFLQRFIVRCYICAVLDVWWDCEYTSDNRSFKWISLINLHYSAQKQPPEVFCKKGVLKNFTKLTGKHLCQSLFLTLLKKRLWHRCFQVNFAKLFRTPFFTEHLRWLLLSVFDSKKTQNWRPPKMKFLLPHFCYYYLFQRCPKPPKTLLKQSKSTENLTFLLKVLF